MHKSFNVISRFGSSHGFSINRRLLHECLHESLFRQVLLRILERGTLRVGYSSDSLPFVFTNEDGELVGFDIEMAHTLAGELGVSLELVRIEESDLPGLLDAGYQNPNCCNC